MEKMTTEQVMESPIKKELDDLKRLIRNGRQLGKHALGRVTDDPAPWDVKDSDGLINRQVALCAYSHLMDLWDGDRTKLQKFTGKNQSHWNYQLLGTTLQMSDFEGFRVKKYRKEQRTSEYFVVTLLEALKAHGIGFDFDHFFQVMGCFRWRVIAKPWKGCEAHDWWMDGPLPESIGVDYPAPWQIANDFGSKDSELIERLDGMQEYVDDWNPCRVENLGVNAYELPSDEIINDQTVGTWCFTGVDDPSPKDDIFNEAALNHYKEKASKLSLEVSQARQALENLREHHRFEMEMMKDMHGAEIAALSKPKEVRLMINPATGEIQQL